MKISYVVRTLGCKANLADTQRMEAELQAAGLSPWQAGAGNSVKVCIINSCTVTDEADRQTRRLAARLSREHPEAAIVVTGCAAEVDPERLRSSQGIRYIIGNRDKPALVSLILQELAAAEKAPPQPKPEAHILGRAEGYAELASRHPMDREWPDAGAALGAPVMELEGHSRKTRLFLKIQEGCNSFCTYCVIPYGRGPSRSLEPEFILGWVKEAVASGVREVVLTGTNIGDYGTDWAGEWKLEHLLERILGETGLERLRVSSLDPTEITPGIVSLMAREPRLCPHFHLSLQSASDRVLRFMKRRYSTAAVRDCFERIARVPAGPGGVFVGMDVITGFPGETIDEFDSGLRVLGELPWTRLHVFPYSEREGTPATRLPDRVAAAERQKRARALNALSFERLNQWHLGILEECRQGAALDKVLLEKGGFRPPETAAEPSRLWFAGYTPNYVRVAVAGDKFAPSLRNAVLSVKPLKIVTEAGGGGEVILLSEPVIAGVARG